MGPWFQAKLVGMINQSHQLFEECISSSDALTFTICHSWAEMKLSAEIQHCYVLNVLCGVRLDAWAVQSV